MDSFKVELERLINRFSKENGSDTPDFILAQFLLDCLDAFEKAVNARNDWWCEKDKSEREKLEEEIESLTVCRDHWKKSYEDLKERSGNDKQAENQNPH